MKKYPLHLSQVALAALALTASLQALAQEAEKKAEQLETVIVTTNRRAEAAQKVSSVVQSITGEQLRKDGVAELRDLQTVIPGMSISTQEGAVDIYIRGVGTGNNTELGDPGAAPHINGVYLPRPRGMGLMFFDLERVEVNKGPQGTLYGRNALAGSINIITAKPKLGQTGGYLQAGGSNRSGADAEGALNLGVSDTFALRGAFQYVKRDMGYKNASPSLGSGPVDPSKLKPAGQEDNWALRLSSVWDITDKLRWSVMADGGHERGTGYPGSDVRPAALATGKPAYDFDLRNIHYRGPQGELRNDMWGIQSKFDYDMGPVAAELTTSYRSVNFYQRNASSAGIDFPGFSEGHNYDDFQSVFWQAKSGATVGELRLYNTDPKADFKWTAGAFGFGERQSTAFFTTSDRGYCCYSGTEFTMPLTKVSSSAVYADATYKLSEDLRVIGGLRQSSERKYRYGIGGNYALVLGGYTPDNNYNCCFGTRYGTEGFKPALLARQDGFDVSALRPGVQWDQLTNAEKQARARYFLNSFLTPGARDTATQQIGRIADGSNMAGTCFQRPDIVNWGVPCPPPAFNGNNGGFTFAQVGVPEQQLGTTKASYGDFRLGFEHDLGKDAMVYGKVSTGHKGGGFNDTVGGKTLTYKPEHITVYEAGSRNVFNLGGKRVVANATAFYYDYKDYVLQSLQCTGTSKNPDGTEVCSGVNLFNENAAAARIAGLELEFKVPLWSGSNLDINYAYLDTQIRSGVVADARSIDFSNGQNATNIDIKGNRMPLASKSNLSLRWQNKFALGSGSFDWQLVGLWRSQYYLDHFNDREIHYINGTVKSALEAGLSGSQKSYWQFNLGAGYEFGNGMRLEGYVTNLTDVQASQKRIVGQNFDLRFLNDARTYGLRGRYSF